ncbi:hypothetical protein ABS858_02200 [Vibrio neptunius]|uniref:hypothetical protein n=1 Tax=Vibrio neptunius TaxID=170651 RepID=UPI003314C706
MRKIKLLLLLLLFPREAFLSETDGWNINTTDVSIVNLYNFYNEVSDAIDKELIVRKEDVTVSSLQDYIGNLTGKEASEFEAEIQLARDIDGSAAQQLNLSSASDVAYLADEIDSPMNVFEYTYPNECLHVDIVTIEKNSRDMVIEIVLMFPYDRKDECLDKAMVAKFIYIGSVFQLQNEVNAQDLIKNIYNTLETGKVYKQVVADVEIMAGFVDETTLGLKLAAVQ